MWWHREIAKDEFNTHSSVIHGGVCSPGVYPKFTGLCDTCVYHAFGEKGIGKESGTTRESRSTAFRIVLKS